ncbi:MAG: DUF2835 family protein [Gammaproteobacteria bacterium]|nr:DUF2835 family protein [Gammaproteobacteria bacterium]
MRNFKFTMGLTAEKTRAIYAGQARFILVETDQGLKLQLPAATFLEYVNADGIHVRFDVKIDANNKILALRRI